MNEYLKAQGAEPAAVRRAGGPRRMPVVGLNVEAMRWSRDPVGYLTKLYRTYGLICAWESDRPRRVFAFAPEHNQRVLSNPDLFHVTPGRRAAVTSANAAMANLRSGLLGLDGEEHRRHRRLMTPAFHQKQVESYRDNIVEMTRRMLAGWTAGEVRDVEADMRRLVHRVAMQAVLSLSDEGALDSLDSLIEELLSAAPRAMLFPFDLPGSSHRRMLRAADRIEDFLKSLVEGRQSDAAEARDILSMMMNARHEGGAGFKSTELVAEAYNVLCHETSASALVWTLFLLAQHPEEYDALREELRGALRGDAPSLEQLGRLPLLERVVKESMRLLPAAPFGTRFSTQACRLGPYELPKGAAVTFSQYVTHRLPELYPQPHRFLPLRWERYKPALYEYFPFGAGVHNCIGGAFAMLEMKLVLALVLQSFTLKVVPHARVDRAYRLSLRPRRGLPMQISPPDRRPSRSPVSGDINQMVELN